MVARNVIFKSQNVKTLALRGNVISDKGTTDVSVQPYVAELEKKYSENDDVFDNVLNNW